MGYKWYLKVIKPTRGHSIFPLVDLLLLPLLLMLPIPREDVEELRSKPVGVPAGRHGHNSRRVRVAFSSDGVYGGRTGGAGTVTDPDPPGPGRHVRVRVGSRTVCISKSGIWEEPRTESEHSLRVGSTRTRSPHPPFTRARTPRA